MDNQSLQNLRLHWESESARNLPDIDWLGESITSADFIDQINSSRAIIKDLVLKSDSLKTETFGIAIEDSLNNLALGIALILEGVAQAIIPLEATKIQQEQLYERYQVTILATSKRIDDNNKWISTTRYFKNIYFYHRSNESLDIQKANTSKGKNATKDETSISLLFGTTSGTTSKRPGIISANSDWFLSMAKETIWSPYFLINRPLVGTCMQNWSSRHQKLLLILRGKSFVARQSGRALAQQSLIDNCDGATISPNILRFWIAEGNIKYLPESFLLISGSDRIPMDLRQDISKIKHVTLGITYATSQTGPITWLPPEALLEEEDSVGWPLKHVKITTIESAESLKTRGKVFSEAIIRTPRTTFNPGDYLHISQSGQVIFGGRSSEVFLFNSILVSPLEIEDVLKKHAGIKECAAFGGQSNRFGSVPMAAYTIQPGWPENQIDMELDALCREHLGKIRPRKYVALKTLPIGNTGKILRRELSRIHSLKL